jgi:hypothetical protein
LAGIAAKIAHLAGTGIGVRVIECQLEDVWVA